MEPRIQYAQTSDGVSIAYAVFGEGPPIVFAGNLWGDIHLYSGGFAPVRAVTDGLVERGWRVVRYDARGMGSSDREPSDFSLEGRARDLEAVIEAIGADRFTLCASTQGGPGAIAYAARHSERVSHLIPTNSFARGADYYEAIPTLQVARNLRHIAEDQWEFFTLTIANAVLGFSDSEVARGLAATFRAEMSPKAFLAYRDAAEKIDVTDLLGSISVPTLVVHDTSTALGDFSALAQKLAPHIPGARFVVTNDAASAIDQFLREGGLTPTPAPIAARKERPESGAFRTILFTDIVGHTEMMQRLGDEKGRDVLREHERITREVLKAYGGTEVKTMGDGFLASFGSVTKAVKCAIALQKGFAEWNASTAHPEALEGRAEPRRPVEPLHVRVGLNAGEPIEEEGDLFGSAVILASRIASAAKGGEILAADVVHGLCSGKPFVFSDRGEQALRGFENPVRLFEVSWR